MASRPVRRRLVAAGLAASTTLAGVTALAGSATAAPAGGDLPRGDLTPKHVNLPAARDADGDQVAPASLPTNGRYAFLLKLDTASTAARFRAVDRTKSTAAARSAAKSQLGTVTAAQNHVIGQLPSLAGGSKVLYRTHAALAGVAVLTDVKNFHALGALTGVSAVYPIAPKTPSNSYAVPFQGAPTAWEGDGTNHFLGQGVTVADIDTGFDYTHADFGGPGTTQAYQAAHNADTTTPEAGSYDPAKFDVADSYDLVGDDYNADPTGDSGPYQPTPHADTNPLDCSPAYGGEGHGSHTAGTIAGYGVTSGGSTYAGPYDAAHVSTDKASDFEIGPGMAPKAKVMALRVFGCEGSTDVVADAIDRAMDPNGDGDTSDHVDVINMSLGSDYGTPDDGDAVAANAAADEGATLAISMGNSYDVYDIGGSPGTASKAITVAASMDAQSIVDGTQVSFDGTAQDPIASERSIAYDWGSEPDLSGQVVIPQTDTTGCDAFGDADKTRIQGKIALLTWTDDKLECGSAVRGANVRAAGGVGFIFASNLESFSAGITGDAQIPGVLLAHSGAQAIRDAIAAGKTVTVNGTSVSSVTQTFQADNDKMTDFSSRGIRAAGDLKPNVAAVGATVFSVLPGSGSQGQNMSGTSMAAPMVAGLAAIVKSEHAEWSPEQIKADIVNTADKKLYVGGSADQSSARYAPMRVGSGRIDAAKAISNDTLATVVDDPGTVALSWGTVAVGAKSAPSTYTKTVNLQNTGSSAHTYAVSFDQVTKVPGTTYTASPQSITVPAGASRTVKVTLRVDPSSWSKSFDASKGDTDPATGYPQQTIAESSGDVVLTPQDSSDALRVPYYSAPKPVSAMAAPANVAVAVAGSPLKLSGTGLDRGTGAGEVFSLGQGFELQATSPVAPTCAPDEQVDCKMVSADSGADIQYVGTSADSDYLYFGVSTHGVHSTPSGKYETDIYLDPDGDGTPDLVAFNTHLGDSDLMVEELYDLAKKEVVDVEFLNNSIFEDTSHNLFTLDTAMYDSDVAIYPVARAALADYGVSSAHPVVDYAMVSYGAVGSQVDEVGWDASGWSPTLKTNTFAPGVVVNESYDGATFSSLVDDQPSAPLRVTRNVATYNATQGKGLLFFHLHNAVGKKAQVIGLRGSSAPRVTVAPASVQRGAAFTATVTVPTIGGLAVPTGSVTLKVDGRAYRTSTLTAGRAVFRVRSASAGRHALAATYAGDANYGASNSGVAAVTVAKSRVAPRLTAPGTARKGKRVTATVKVATVAGIAPTGRVTLKLNGKRLAAASLRRGKAVISFTLRTRGKITLVATYAGDRNYRRGTSRKVVARIR